MAARCKSSDGTCSRRVVVSVRVLFALFTALAAFAADADAPKTVKVIREADKVVVRKRTVVDFNDVTVEGELTKPEGSYVLNRNKIKFKSLIKLRGDFNAELQKSADNL
jgi:hypothetical protein